MAAIINVHFWSDRGEKLRTIERETGCTTGEVFERLVQRADPSPLGLITLFPERFKGWSVEEIKHPDDSLSVEEANRRAAIARMRLLEAQAAKVSAEANLLNDLFGKPEVA